MSSDLFAKQIAAPAIRKWRPQLKQVLWAVSSSLRIAKLLITGPFRLAFAIRRSMTVASISVMLLSLMSLNIIWGYPWTGMMGACLSLILIGWSVNQIMRPMLRVGCTLPTSCPAGQPFRILTHLSNTRRLPGLDILVRFDHSARVLQGAQQHVDVQSSSGEFYSLIRPQKRADYQGTLLFEQRGIYQIPSLVIQSTFPFYLFRSTSIVDVDAQIAITPTPLDGEHDSAAMKALTAVGKWAHKLLSGDAIEYTGSREYQVGMPVRRWDFKSWARLGRPIVREYQSPSVRAINLIVDTADESLKSSGRKPRRDPNESLERLLSLATSTIATLASRSVHIQLYVTSESLNMIDVEQRGRIAKSDRESMLIRLAGAETVDVATADERCQSAMQQVGSQPTLVLTARPDSSLSLDSRGQTTVICIDQLDQNETIAHVSERSIEAPSQISNSTLRHDPAHPDPSMRSVVDDNRSRVPSAQESNR